MNCVKPWKHFVTITRHRFYVQRGCFAVGLYKQGLTHDLSKYKPREFWAGAKYYQGNRSPNVAERNDKGFSEAWMHHKGHNRHHWEYWTDISMTERRYAPVVMPRKYLVEMVMDRIAACKNYNRENYYDGAALDYLNSTPEKALMHPETKRQLEYLLTMLRDKGEKETFSYIKYHVLKDKPFPWEET